MSEFQDRPPISISIRFLLVGSLEENKKPASASAYSPRHGKKKGGPSSIDILPVLSSRLAESDPYHPEQRLTDVRV